MGLRCHLSQIDDSIAERLVSGERPQYESASSLDIDKAWGGIHFLLCGSVDSGSQPERFIMSGYQLPEVSEHVAVHRASEVADFDVALARVSDEELLGRMEFDEMNRLDVYPGDWGEADRPYLAEYLLKLRRFISDTASADMALIVTIL